MPIYEYYCPENHTVYQFYAKTLAQGKSTPKCPDNPKHRMIKCVSSFAVTRGGKSDETPPAGPDDGDGRMEAAMAAMEKEFAHLDENDPRGMGRMMRRMTDVQGWLAGDCISYYPNGRMSERAFYVGDKLVAEATFRLAEG